MTECAHPIRRTAKLPTPRRRSAPAQTLGKHSDWERGAPLPTD
jgi:hypothetical protein